MHRVCILPGSYSVVVEGFRVSAVGSGQPHTSEALTLQHLTNSPKQTWNSDRTIIYPRIGLAACLGESKWNPSACL